MRELVKRNDLNLSLGSDSDVLKKLHGPSPRANYTDRGTAACRFSRQEPLLFYQVAPQLYSRG
jgi:hypothetical protein